MKINTPIHTLLASFSFGISEVKSYATIKLSVINFKILISRQ
jgi:hypothetical protein